MIIDEPTMVSLKFVGGDWQWTPSEVYAQLYILHTGIRFRSPLFDITVDKQSLRKLAQHILSVTNDDTP